MKKFVLIFAACSTVIFGSLIMFTFLTTDVPTTQILSDFKSLGHDVNTRHQGRGNSGIKTVDEVITRFKDESVKANGQASITIGQGAESGFLNDTYPMILTFPVKESAGKHVRFTSKFQPNRKIKLYAQPRDHNGVDLNPQVRNTKGVSIVAAHHGNVTTSCYKCRASSYGHWIEIKDPRTGLKTRYAHLASRDVEAGAIVKAGQKIGEMGTTGNSEGIHLHFELVVDEITTGLEINKKYIQGKRWYNPVAPNVTYDIKSKPDGGVKFNGQDFDFNFVSSPGES